MTNILEYKGYYGSVEFSASDNVFYGKLIGVNSLISFEGESVDGLRADFEGAVDDYVEMCKQQGVSAEKTYKGSFNVRVSPDLHKQLAMLAAAKGKSLNASVEEAISKYVAN